MKKSLKIFGVIILASLVIATLVGLAVMTIWLFRKGRSSDWSTWTWICVLTEGIGTLVFAPLGIYMSIFFAKERIQRIKKQ